MEKRKTNKKSYGGSTKRPQRMTPKAGFTKTRRRLGCGGKLK
jgi:hypothetical protein